MEYTLKTICYKPEDYFSESLVYDDYDEAIEGFYDTVRAWSDEDMVVVTLKRGKSVLKYWEG